MEKKDYDKYIDKEALIRLVKERPVLWDRTQEIYKDKDAKSAAWREIFISLMADFENLQRKERNEFGKLVIKKWGHTRDSWIKTLKNERDPKRCNKSGAPSRPYRYHRQMLFLKKVVIPSETPGCLLKRIKHEEDDIVLEVNEDDDDNTQEDQFDSHCFEQLTPNTAVKRKFVDVDEPVVSNFEQSEEHKHAAKRKFVDIDEPMISNFEQSEDRNLLFFKSLLPSLAMLEDDETLEFQSRVIKVLQNIKSRRDKQFPTQSHYARPKIDRVQSEAFCEDSESD